MTNPSIHSDDDDLGDYVDDLKDARALLQGQRDDVARQHRQTETGDHADDVRGDSAQPDQRWSIRDAGLCRKRASAVHARLLFRARPRRDTRPVPKSAAGAPGHNTALVSTPRLGAVGCLLYTSDAA